MKKFKRAGFFPALLFCCFLLFGGSVSAKEEERIKTGVYAGEVNLSGMTKAEAEAAVEEYVQGLEAVEITLVAAAQHQVTVTAGELGITWSNPELTEEAVTLGTHGNVVQRYKVLKDLEHENKVFPIEVSFDLQAINDVLTNKCSRYDQKAVNVSLKRENGVFEVVEGQIGYALDVETSIDVINDYLTGEWDFTPCTIVLDVAIQQPKGSAEELAEVKDVLGTFTTSYKTSRAARSANVENGCQLINGITLYPGEEFSTYETVAPFSEANGYYMAGSYVSGKVVDSLGGGICQVSTTLYNAVLKAELDVTERYNHSMIVSYVGLFRRCSHRGKLGEGFQVCK